MKKVGVCSWSLCPGSPEELAERAAAVGVGWVQLALDPIRRGEWDEAQTVAALRETGIGIASGMMAMEGEDYSTLESIRQTGGVAPDTTWPANLAAARDNAALAARLGLKLVTFHAGFIPHEKSDPRRAAVLGRLRELARTFGECGIKVALETGQETAATLLGVLAELPGVGVNFDPANIILYGMGEPVAALRLLAPMVVQVHIKDATPSALPGAWGSEVPVGTGAVDWGAFFETLTQIGCNPMIEREAGENRVADAALACRLIERLYA